MNKFVTLFFILFVTSTSYADTTLYGSLRGAVEWFGTDTTIVDNNTGVEVGSIKDTTIDVVDKNQVSRLGIKGNEDLGNGMNALYHLEFRVRTDVGGLGTRDRLSYTGLDTPYGTFLIGRQWSPYYNATDYNDIFRGSSSYLLYQQPFRLSDTITYKTPAIYGLSVSSGFMFGTSADENEVLAGLEDQDQIDTWVVAAEWEWGGFDIGASYLENADDIGKYTAAAVGYQNDLFRLGFVFEANIDGDRLYSVNDISNTISSSKQSAYHYNIAGEYYITDKEAFRAGFAFLDREGIGNTRQYVIGLEHKFSKRTVTWLEYTYTSSNELELIRESNIVGNYDADDHLISIGFRHDF